MSDMKLSEAMRLGAMLNPQGFIGGSTPEERNESVNGETTCALVAAQRAVGRDGTSLTMGWPWLHSVTAPCPDAGCLIYDRTAEDTMFIRILHLNDHHKWTREAIADWVETIERRAEADQAGTQQETATTSVSFAQKA